MITGKNYIGRELRNGSEQTFHTYNPVTGEPNNCTFYEASAQETEEACQLAASAFEKYRNASDQKRASFLYAIADAIEALGDPLIHTYCQESGLTESRGLAERGRTCFQLRSLADMLMTGNWKEVTKEEALPDREPKPKADLRKSYIPLGPVVVFGSSNFPLAYSTAGGDTASALAVGCPVIVKSHPMHAGTGEMVAGAILQAAEKTGMPEGVFSNLNAQGYSVGKQLVEDYRVKAVGFTGSIRGGRALMDLASARPEPIPVFAEMGSINPVLISNGALREKAEHWAQLYADSITLGTGQFCTSPGLLIGIDSPELDQFASLLAQKMLQKEPTVMLGENIKKAYTELKEEIKSEIGVETLTDTLEVQGNLADQTIVAVSGEVFLDNPKLHHEVFGPFSIIVKCKDEEERLQIIDQLEGQLTGTVICTNYEISSTKKLVEKLSFRVGRIIFNGVSTGVEVCPAMNHGGPYPASSDPRFTAVGLHGIRRWIRPICYQNFPKELLPMELQ